MIAFGLIAFVIVSQVAAFNNTDQSRWEVFHIGVLPAEPGYRFTKREATEACFYAGALLATKADLQAAFEQGANWCSWGWTEESEGWFPNNYDRDASCQTPGTLVGPIQGPQFNGPLNKRMAANCYGLRPAKSSVPSFVRILPFNKYLWSTYDRTA